MGDYPFDIYSPSPQKEVHFKLAKVMLEITVPGECFGTGHAASKRWPDAAATSPGTCSSLRPAAHFYRAPLSSFGPTLGWRW